MAELLAYDTGDDAAAIEYGTEEVAQNFTSPVTCAVTTIEVKIYRVGSPSGYNSLSIYTTDANGHPDQLIDSYGVTSASITTDTNGDWVVFTMTGVNLTAGDVYAIRLTGGDSAGVYLAWRYDNNDATLSGGVRLHSTDGGSSWVEQSGDDFMFRINGSITFTPPVDIVTTKRLVALCNNSVYYEDSAGSMTELDTSAGRIDTSDQARIFSAFQKAFIVNGSNLKVADFINTKITTTDLNTHAPDKGNVLTGGTSGAAMVVDYITSTTADAACTIYGYRTTAATFESGETVTGTDDDGNSITFVLNANEVSNPHWYNWTVYGADSNFGTMPAKAYLGCRYRGRCVLSGNPNYPHQWYMSKVSNPFDFVYDSTDPLTAISGQNADAGEIGDIIRALIPYGDDFLVFGCANSIHILDGDPAMGGSIDQLDDTTGIFGATSWCKDGQGNLYFWGAGGLYRMEGGRSRPQNISQGNLPKWVDDWAANPSTHRIVLSYDPFRQGIIISRTTLADGTNLNYWYSLKLEAFYPETYPEEAAIYSSIYYDANSSLRNLILGGKDGYIREFVDTAKDDDAGASDEAISSYCVLPMIKLGIEDNDEGKLTSLTIELAGGAASGAYSDTDGVTYELHIGDDAETVMEDIEDGATAFASGTLSGTGRQSRIRTRARGRWLGIKLYNSTASETWVVNLISGEVKPGGKIKS